MLPKKTIITTRKKKLVIFKKNDSQFAFDLKKYLLYVQRLD